MAYLTIESSNVVEQDPHELSHMDIRVGVGVQRYIELEMGFRGADG
jgi:hypothetical protein